LSPGDRAVAAKQIAGMFATSGLLAGAAGMPIMGVMGKIFNMLKEDDEDDFDTVMTAELGAGPYNGLLYSMGLDIGQRIGMSNLLYRSLPNQEQESAVLYALEMGGGPIASILIRMIDQGVPLLKEGEYNRAIEKMAPSSIANLARASRFYRKAATTMRGDPIIEDIGGGAILAQLFGFAPADYTRQLEINARDKFQDNAVNRESTKLLSDHNYARRFRLYDEIPEIDEKIAEFNRRHPEIPITPEVKRRSEESYHRTTEALEQTGGVFISPRRRPTVLLENQLMFGI